MSENMPPTGEAGPVPETSESQESRRGFGVLAGAAAAGALALLARPQEAKADLSIDDVTTGVNKAFGGNAISGVGDAVGGFFNRAGDSVKNFLQKIIDAILDKIVKPIVQGIVGSNLSGLEAWPKALSEGPAQVLQGLGELHDVLDDLGDKRGEEIKNRITAVKNSIKAIKESTGIKGGPLDQVADMPFEILHEAFNSRTDPIKILNNVLLRSLDAGKIVQFLMDRLFKSQGSISNCFQMPNGLKPGMLNDWVNGKLQPGVNGIEPVERQFRLRIAAEFDKYVRGTASRTLKGELVGTDKSTSTQLLLEIIGLLLNTTLTFVFEPLQFPEIPEEWTRFEDAGEEYARTAGRQLRVAVQGSIGSVLRGIWAYNVYNDNLIEGVATLFGTLVSGITEGLVRNLAFEFEIAAIYRDCDFEKWDKLSVVEPFESWETVEQTLDPADRLLYVVLVRGFPGDQQMAAKLRGRIGGIEKPVHGVLRDLAAYNDVATSAHRQGIRFSPVVADAVTLERLDLIGEVLHVEAHSAALGPSRLEVPPSVLRVYVGSQVVVMRPEVANGSCTGKYSATIPVRKAYLSRTVEVRVVSSRGGTVKRNLEAAGV